MSNQSNPLAISSISTSVYAALKKDIMDGTLQPGHRLLVLEIAGTYQISQAPVREALERLKQEGLIVGQPNKGSVVSSITPKEIKDLFVLREIIESFAVKQSIKLLSEHDYTRLEQILAEMESAIQNNDSLLILEKDMEFHGYFYSICNNEAILELWQRMRTKMMRFMAISNRHYSTEKLVDWHLQLLDALRLGDAQIAEDKFIEHMHAYKIIDME